MAKVRLLRGLVLPMRIAPFGASPDAPVLTGQYVPMTKEERDAYQDSVLGQNPAKRAELLAAEVGRRVLSWDVDGADPKKVEDVKALPPLFLDRIEVHLTGYAVSPEATADEKKSAAPPS